MEISKENLIRINNGFGGNLRNDNSIDFAISKQSDSKIGDFKKLSYLLRAILVDHPFSDGNKRTAMFVCMDFAMQTDSYIDTDLLPYQIVAIAKKNLTNLRNIEWRIKNAIR